MNRFDFSLNAKRIGFLSVFVVFLLLALRWRRTRASFAGQTIVITGGSRGLGLALAQCLVRERVNLAIIARDEKELARAKSTLLSQGSVVTTWVCDVRKESELRSTIEGIAERFGAIDVLVNNAGEIIVGPFEAMNREDFERALEIHFWAPLNAILASLPYLQKKANGRIINVASFGGRLAVPHLLPYCASKFALAGLSDGLRAELAAKNISVTTVSPGLVRTGSHKTPYLRARTKKSLDGFLWEPAIH